MTIWLFLGMLAALYFYSDIKLVEKRCIDDIDYVMFLAYIIFGAVSFVVALFDIGQKHWWYK